MKRFITTILTMSLMVSLFSIPADSVTTEVVPSVEEVSEEAIEEPSIEAPEEIAVSLPQEPEPELEEEVTPAPQPEEQKPQTSFRPVTATAYCNWCNSPSGTCITASGATATAGRTIAASSKYAFGTQIEIEGMGVYTVEDRGGRRIQNGAIDIFFYYPDRCHCNDFGVKTVQMRIVQ